MNTKRKQKILFFLLSIAILGFTMVGKPARAEEEPPLGFEVEPVQPATQIDKEKKYFYLKVEPNVQQTVEIKVTGKSETPTKVKVFMANAITSEGGTVAYKAGMEKDPTLTESIEEIITVSDPEFEIKKDEERTVTLTITPPKASFEGIKLGTVYFQQENEEESEEKNAITSAYAYRIGMILAENEEDYSNSKTLNLLSAKAELSHSFKTIQLEFQNPEPKMIADVTMTASIIDKKTGKVVKKQKLENGSIAPNSRFKFGVDWGIDIIPAGKYQAKVESKSRYDSWTLEKDFEISASTAKKMNEEALNKLTLPEWAYFSIVGAGLLTVLVGGYLVIRQKKWKQRMIKQKKTKKRKGKKNEKRRKMD